MRSFFLLALITFLAACGTTDSELSAATSIAGDNGSPSDLSTPLLEPSGVSSPSPTSATAATDSATEIPTPLVETPTSPAQNPETPVIIFEQSGGLMGIMQTWAIFAGGQVLSEQNSTCQVEPESISGIQTTALESGFFEMSFPEAAAICCDFFTYTLTIHSEDRVNTVVVSEGDPKMPQELRELIAAVQQTVSSCSS